MSTKKYYSTDNNNLKEYAELTGLVLVIILIGVFLFNVPSLYNSVQFRHLKGVYVFPINQNSNQPSQSLGGQSLVLALGDDGHSAEMIISPDGKTMYYQRLNYQYNYHYNNLELNLTYQGITQPVYLDYESSGWYGSDSDNNPNGYTLTCDTNCNAYPLYNNTLQTYSSNLSLANSLVKNSGYAGKTVKLLLDSSSRYDLSLQDQLYSSALGAAIHLKSAS